MRGNGVEMGETLMPHEGGGRPVDRFDERRRELAESALVTLAKLGYAKTSLREIAANSDFSHGVLHYYFADKQELIVYCVRHFKSTCAHRYDDVVESSTTAEELLDGFVGKLGTTLREDAAMHRLWYDLRSQSMFEPSLREAVDAIDQALADMVWRILSRYAELRGVAVPASPPTAYALIDGLFQQGLLGHIAGRADAITAVQSQVRGVVELMFGEADEVDGAGDTAA